MKRAIVTVFPGGGEVVGYSREGKPMKMGFSASVEQEKSGKPGKYFGAFGSEPLGHEKVRQQAIDEARVEDPKTVIFLIDELQASKVNKERERLGLNRERITA